MMRECNKYRLDLPMPGNGSVVEGCLCYETGIFDFRTIETTNLLIHLQMFVDLEV